MEAGFADRELREAGFDVIALRDPFIRHERTEEWMMVAQQGTKPDQRAVMPPAASSGASFDTPAQPGTDSEIASPDLRISMNQFSTLLNNGEVLVLDVRGADEYVAGHVPGALLTPLADLADRVSEFSKETRKVVTYCS